jgi:type II secretory pathway pseudopilin PulG
MKSSASRFSSQRGSALITVTVVIAVGAILSGSMLAYSLSERRGNERNRLQLRAQTVAENISLYAAEQLTTKLYRLGSTPIGYFPWTGSSTSVIHMPPNSVLVSEYNDATAAGNMEVRAAIEAAGAYALVNDPNSPNNGLQVATARVPIISKGTATLPAIGTITAYVEQDMELALTPLFQFGMFYNMDLELYPNANFTVSGPVHTNNSLMAHANASATINILFTDRVTAADYVIADHSLKARPRSGDGSYSDPTAANGNVTFTDLTTASPVSLKNSSNLWRDRSRVVQGVVDQHLQRQPADRHPRRHKAAASRHRKL